jgi:glutathione S-transferase
MATELGLSFEHRPLEWQQCGRDEAYLALNPAGTIPAVVDGDFVLSESLAINLYLARKFGSLLPVDPQEQAKVMQWSFWAATTLEDNYIQWAEHSHWLPAALRDPTAAASAAANLNQPLDRLELALSKSEWLVGASFTVADLNVASTIALLRNVEREKRPFVARWLNLCFSRSAYIQAAKLP